ncbi:MAG TPA: CAP domain-containing protein [Thermomicrobiales bacterium]|nr:CAP domain-containing protein [Thermomicrobiales bacterium]
MRVRQGPPPRRTAAWALGALLAILALTLPAAGLAPARPVAAADDGTATALAAINQARAALGIPPLARSAALDGSAGAHATYYRLNYGDPTLGGMGLHYETPGKPGFTGVDFAARAKAAGYSGSINENIGLSGSILVSLDWFMGTVNHRLTLLDPRYTDVGFGVVNDGAAKIEVIDLGTIVWRDTIAPTWEPWPPPNARDIGARFDGETPNPFPGATFPLGYPVTLKYNGAGAVTFTGGQLARNGQAVASVGATGAGFITRNTYLLAAITPLQPGATYTVTVQGTAAGQAFTQSWNFTTKGTGDAPPPATPVPAPTPSPAPAPSATPAPSPAPTPAPSPTSTPGAALPPGVATMDPAAVLRWRAADADVYHGTTKRTWTWGPDVLATRQEDYASAPGGRRTVYYFDKSRMEINDPNGDRASAWFVTNGLLVREMISGQLQVGDRAFTPRGPAAVTVAGDPAAQNPTCATYAALAGVASLAPGQHGASDQTGQAITATIDANGIVGRNPHPPGAASYGHFDPTLGHNIADVFWRWLQAQPADWVYAAGYPLTEPYWTLTKINGVDTWVLVQAFERRVLTYNPANPAGWQVEAGNVGRHYYEWRYGVPPTPPERP